MGGLGDFVASEDAYQLINPGALFQKELFLAFDHAAGDDDSAELAVLFELLHLADDGEGFLPGGREESAGVDDNEVGPLWLGKKRVALQIQKPEHPFAVHKVLWTAERD